MNFSTSVMKKGYYDPASLTDGSLVHALTTETLAREDKRRLILSEWPVGVVADAPIQAGVIFTPLFAHQPEIALTPAFTPPSLQDSPFAEPLDYSLPFSPSKAKASKPKACTFPDCKNKAPYWAIRCQAHGGGDKPRCDVAGCTKNARDKSGKCTSHGGGKRCEVFGCTKSARGRTATCIAHGGGIRCSVDGCTKSARDKSARCIAHGGGKRCKVLGCHSSAIGKSAECASHSRRMQKTHAAENISLSFSLGTAITHERSKTHGTDEKYDKPYNKKNAKAPPKRNVVAALSEEMELAKEEPIVAKVTKKKKVESEERKEEITTK